MPKPEFILSSSINNCSIQGLLIKNSFYPYRLYVIIIFLSSFQLVYISCINPVSFTVTENCQKDTIIGDMSAYRKPSEKSLMTIKKIYSIESIGNEQLKDLFLIDSISGIIRVSHNIDRELICPHLSATSGTCSVTLLVTILNDIINIIIIIVDENDNRPLFASSNIIINVKESTPLGTHLYLKHATDLDSLDNGIGEYRLTSEKVTNPFSLKYNLTVIYLELIHTLDYETCDVYQLTLSVCDIGTPKKCSSQLVKINILDVNDNYPVFKKQKYFAIINEDHPVGKIILQVSATDLDSDKYGSIRYQFTSTNNEAKRWFQLDPSTGQIFLIRPLSTQYKNFNFIIEARDSGPVPNVNRTLITIHIKDINNHHPDIKITESTFNAKIIKTGPNKSIVSFYENNPRNTDIIFIVVTDKDSDDNGRVQCSMKPFNSDWLQMLKFNYINNKVIYRLVALFSADCESMREITVVITCSDSGEKPKSSTHTIVIKILDVNEFPAVFNKSFYSLSVKENTVSFNLPLPIYDEDCSSDVVVNITDLYAKSHFRFLQTHQLVLFSHLDFEKKSSVNFSIEIINKGAHGIFLTSTTSFFITVTDINDNAPVFLEPTTFHVTEDTKPGTHIGYIKANDSDENQNSIVLFHKINISNNKNTIKGFEKFKIGNDGSIKLTKELDREKENLYFLPILATDMGNPVLSTTGTITISILDINDNNPQWIFPIDNDNRINESIYTRIGTVITRLNAIDIDELSNTNITYHIISGNAKDFYLHPVKGELSFLSTPKQGENILDIIAIDNGIPARSNQTKLFLYISDKPIIDGTEFLASRSYFTLVAVVPIMILICILMLILCLLLVVRRRNVRNKNRRTQINSKTIESLSRKPFHMSNPKEKLLQTKMIDNQLDQNMEMQHNIDTLDLTQTKPLPKVSYQCLVTNDMDMCSADSGEGASEDDISNYLMLKSNDQYRIGGCNQHCCSLLPENSIAHFICSTINHPMLYSQAMETLTDDPNSYLMYNTKCNTNIQPIAPNTYKMACLSPMCKKL